MSIVLHGISMGGATVLMVSGEELSDNVKAIVADCSYTSAYDEFKYYLKNKGCPPFLLLPSATLLSKKTSSKFCTLRSLLELPLVKKYSVAKYKSLHLLFV